MLIKLRKVRHFLRKKDGMVTVEWVALSAAVLVGGIAIAWTVLNNLDPVAKQIGSQAEKAAGTVTKAPTIASPNFGDGSNGT